MSYFRRVPYKMFGQSEDEAVLAWFIVILSCFRCVLYKMFGQSELDEAVLAWSVSSRSCAGGGWATTHSSLLTITSGWPAGRVMYLFNSQPDLPSQGSLLDSRSATGKKLSWGRPGPPPSAACINILGFGDVPSIPGNKSRTENTTSSVCSSV